MRRLLTGVGVVVALWCSLSPAFGQKATERFVPLEQSPGLSRKGAYVGEIAAVNPQERSITVGKPLGVQTVRVTDRTNIWLDRTPLNLMNLTGSFADLQIGRKVEVKYEDSNGEPNAEWIKVEFSETPARPARQ